MAPPALAVIHSRQPAQPGDVVINEILAHTDPPQVDTIELFNPTDAPVVIGGWFLSDNGDELNRYHFPPDTTIPAQGYHLVTGDEVSFGLSEFGETVYLYAPDAEGDPGVRMDQVRFGVSPNGVSFGRYETSTGAIQYPLQRAVTLGETNAGPLVSPVTIAEIMYHPTRGSEYVIVVNRSNVYVPLFDPQHPDNTWQLKIGGQVPFKIPGNTWLAPGAKLIIAAVTPLTLRKEYIVPAGLEVVGPFAGKLSNEGERVALWRRSHRRSMMACRLCGARCSGLWVLRTLAVAGQWRRRSTSARCACWLRRRSGQLAGRATNVEPTAQAIFADGKELTGKHMTKKCGSDSCHFWQTKTAHQMALVSGFFCCRRTGSLLDGHIHDIASLSIDHDGGLLFGCLEFYHPDRFAIVFFRRGHLLCDIAVQALCPWQHLQQWQWLPGRSLALTYLARTVPQPERPQPLGARQA